MGAKKRPINWLSVSQLWLSSRRVILKNIATFVAAKNKKAHQQLNDRVSNAIVVGGLCCAGSRLNTNNGEILYIQTSIKMQSLGKEKPLLILRLHLP